MSSQNDYLEELLSLNFKNFLDTIKTEDKPFQEKIFFQEGPGIRNWQYVEDEDGVKFINIRCIQNNDLILNTANKVSKEEGFGKYSHFLVDKGDLLMSTSGTLGRYAIAREEHLPLCMNTSVIRFRPLEDETYYTYVYCYLTSNIFNTHLINMANGSAQVNFGPTHLKQIEVPWPDKRDVLDFEEKNRPILDSVVALKSENTKLTKLRDTLLPKLMSGEIDVSEIKLGS